MKIFKSAILLFCIIQANLSYAALVTLNGSAIKYEYDDVANSAALAIFGTPTIHGDEIRFLPPSFRAESIDGAGTDLITANFVFSRVYSTNKKAITELKVVEFGDYLITNGDNVTADLLFSVFNNNDVSEFTSDLQSFSASGDSAGVQKWTLTSTVNPILEFSPTANDVAISIQNTLTATTNAAGELAWIQKKLTFIATTEPLDPADVPVPALTWLFGLALLGLARIKRKK
jgi:hypothetical protein